MFGLIGSVIGATIASVASHYQSATAAIFLQAGIAIGFLSWIVAYGSMLLIFSKDNLTHTAARTELLLRRIGVRRGRTSRILMVAILTLGIIAWVAIYQHHRYNN